MMKSMVIGAASFAAAVVALISPTYAEACTNRPTVPPPVWIEYMAPDQVWITFHNYTTTFGASQGQSCGCGIWSLPALSSISGIEFTNSATGEAISGWSFSQDSATAQLFEDALGQGATVNGFLSQVSEVIPAGIPLDLHVHGTLNLCIGEEENSFSSSHIRRDNCSESEDEALADLEIQVEEAAALVSTAGIDETGLHHFGSTPAGEIEVVEVPETCKIATRQAANKATKYAEAALEVSTFCPDRSDELDQLFEDVNAAEADLESKIEEFQSQVDAKQVEFDDLKAQRDAKKAERRQCREELAALIEDDAPKPEIQAKRRECSDLGTQVAELNLAVQQCRDELLALKAPIQTARFNRRNAKISYGTALLEALGRPATTEEEAISACNDCRKASKKLKRRFDRLNMAHEYVQLRCAG